MKRKTMLIGAIAVAVVVALCAAVFTAMWHLPGGSQIIEPAPIVSRTPEYRIPQYHSAVDKDGDGIDDQTDMLRSVRAYIATQPKYKSEYYATGYPDDGYGVCTDVVAAGMRGAGYDLMELVNQDVLAHPERYAIDVPDKNIDFRRVPTLNAYLAAHAIPLTTDPMQIDQWQGGDIVVYTNHVGVVSDKRDAQGIPLLIHHVSADQKQYEEDVLATFHQQIVGHYRIS